MTSVTQHRGLLMNIAYRLLGSVSEAEDAVQEAYARWYALTEEGRAAIVSHTGWLVTVTTRIYLDMLASARARRETYIGEWLPEPVPGDARWTSRVPDRLSDPADRVSLDESLSMALLIVFDSMTPAERVAFVLHDVFRYTFAEIGEIVGRSPAACRQLASSARRRVRAARGELLSTREHERVVSAFQHALETGDLAALLRLLDPASAAIPDGGGLVEAAVEPITGAEEIARYMLGLYDRQKDLTFEVATVSGRSGLIARNAAGEALAVASIAASQGRIIRIWVTRSPDKLRSGADRRRPATTIRCPAARAR